MFCSQCGAAAAEGSRFCAGCGAGLGARQSVVESIGARLSRLASTDKLEGFSLGAMFSEVFKRRHPSELEDYFTVGTSRTTPPIDAVDTGWPKPWFFARVLLFIGLIYLGFTVAAEQTLNVRLLPGLIMMGSLAVPLATVFLFFELNTPRNVPFHSVLMLVAMGGVLSIGISLLGFEMTSLDWLGASEAGIVEEVGKLLTVVLIARQARHRYILNGMLFGAAVGAGFAAFESAGYALERLMETNALDPMWSRIHTRAWLSPFGHVAWTAITAGALWRARRGGPLRLAAFIDPGFLKAAAIPVVIHMIWNSPLPSTLYLKYLLLGVITWFVVFGLVQQGLRQVKAQQLESARAELNRLSAAGGAG
jgi:RsiW-degrading membrane proteinase PrsW (M82 family)